MPGDKEFEIPEPEEKIDTTDDDIYDKKVRERELDDDEIEPWEAGFMEGAAEGGRDAKCRHCGKILVEREDVIERRVEGELYWFCSEKCAEDYFKKKHE